ncbi:MAG: class I SAM-dependent methyltransferase [Acidobacteria bacterium]|nr:class I SAM-dependent methyltransferase [Acidobacteriota bacterium]
MEAYGNFALAYDESLGIRFHRSLEQFVPKFLSRYGIRLEAPHLDLGCGTALAGGLFGRLGLASSSGLDLSWRMLDLARSRTGRLVRADMRRIPIQSGKMLTVTCFYDSLNHLDAAGFARTVRDSARILGPNGTLVFDLTTREAYEEVWSAPEPWCDRGAHHRIEIITSWNPEGGTAIAAIAGRVDREGKTVEIRETRRQWCHDPERVRRVLREAGFELIAEESFDPYATDSVLGASKMVYAARKRAR